VSLLEIADLKVYYFGREGIVRAVDGVSLELKPGSSLGVLGESGCGKSTLGLSILGLVPDPGKIVDGKILFEGNDIVGMSGEELRSIRGSRMSMVFQQPMTSLNPVLTVQDQIAEALIAHKDMPKAEALQHAVELMKTVGIPDAGDKARQYPHQLSGGMQQRVVIAMALACNPSIVIADEPTSALDVTVQAQILGLMKTMRKEYNLSLFLISHNLGVLVELSDEIAVMYAGQIVEIGPTHLMLKQPAHPYTSALMRSTITLSSVRGRLSPVEGMPPNLACLPEGCRFYPRCSDARPLCSQNNPALEIFGERHWVRCFHAH